jgi:hypothetical protein
MKDKTKFFLVIMAGDGFKWIVATGCWISIYIKEVNGCSNSSTGFYGWYDDNMKGRHSFYYSDGSSFRLEVCDLAVTGYKVDMVGWITFQMNGLVGQVVVTFL